MTPNENNQHASILKQVTIGNFEQSFIRLDRNSKF